MSRNSLIFTLIALFVLAAGFLMMQEETAPKTEQNIAPKAAAPVLSEEEQKVAELQKQAAVSTVQTSKLYAARCAACHGYHGEGIVGPKLVGKTEEQLLKSLADYKAGRVPNSLMKGLLTNSTDEELKTLAAEIAKF